MSLKPFHLIISSLLLSMGGQSAAQNTEICNVLCDGIDSSGISGTARIAASKLVTGRSISLYISDNDNMAYGGISGGSTGDEIWVDRSFNGGITWNNGSLLGHTTIPIGWNTTVTMAYNVDHDAIKGLGAFRACGRPLNGVVGCTDWARSSVHATTPIDAAATALMQYYYGSLWHTVGWWNGANALTALVQYMKFTGSRTHFHVIESTFTNNLDGWDGNFTSDALDDTEWWALVWIDAYDLTGERKYLDMAILDADYIYQYHDTVCGGGVWWSIARTYKNAITNSLYILLAAQLHNRIPGDTKYLSQAQELWTWFKGSGMINQDNLVNDGLRDDCTSNRDTTWTYNQGVPIGALVELYRATNDSNYLTEALNMADAVFQSEVLTRHGVLTEPCEYSGAVGCGNHTGGCDCNQISFKGIFMRHLAELNRVAGDAPFQDYIEKQIESNSLSNRNLLSQFGIHYAGPLEDVNAGTQQSSLEAFTAAILQPAAAKIIK